MILWFRRSTDRQDITIFPVCSTLIYSRYQKLVTLGQAALKCSICSKREKRKKSQHGVHISIFSRQKCHGLESGETSVEKKDISTPTDSYRDNAENPQRG